MLYYYIYRYNENYYGGENVDVTNIVREYVDACKEREPIIIKDIKALKEYENARNVAFNRLHKENVIKVFEKGIYYKSKMTLFGEIGIDKQQLINKKYLRQENHVIGYLTGPVLWNTWNITTQVPNRTWIATNAVKRNTDKAKLKVKLLKPKVVIKNDNFELLQFLDVVDQMDQIQDIDLNNYVDILIAKLRNFNEDQLIYIIGLTKYYRKFVNNFTGALIETIIKDINKDSNINSEIALMKVKANLGKKYKFMKNSTLNNTQNWGLY